MAKQFRNYFDRLTGGLPAKGSDGVVPTTFQERLYDLLDGYFSQFPILRNGVPIQSDFSDALIVNEADLTTAAAALGAVNAAVSVPLSGLAGASVLLAGGGTLVGTLVPECSPDGGTTWIQSSFYNPASTAVLGIAAQGLARQVTVSSPAASVLCVMDGPGMSHVRIRVSAYTSGSSNASLRSSDASPATDFGFESPVDGTKATYSAAVIGLATAAAATDVLTIAGGAGKVVRVTQVTAGGTINTAAQYIDINLVKRSAANTGGTSAAVVIPPYDSQNPAPVATVASYTANPTGLGAGVGTIASQRYFAALSGTPGILSPQAVFQFGNRPAQAVVLRSATEILSVHLNAPVNAGVFDINVEWTEE